MALPSRGSLLADSLGGSAAVDNAQPP
jgi:hypothetical protein